MRLDVTKVKPLTQYHMYMKIKDERKGICDIEPYLDLGVFPELEYFGYVNQIPVLFGAVTWPTQRNLAPETLVAGAVGTVDAPD